MSNRSKAIYWPCDDFTDFGEASLAAMSQGLPLMLRDGVIVELNFSLIHKLNSRKLEIIGCGEVKPTIIGNGHSIFQIGGRYSILDLTNLCLRHTCDLDDYRDVGAVIFALNLADVRIQDCEIVSSHGFGVWAVQKASVHLTRCSITSVRRSGLVSFGKSSLSLNECCIQDCNIHSICCRGNTRLTAKNCTFLSAKVRAIYGYHFVNIDMEDCVISGTECSEHAAVDIWCTLPTDGWQANSKLSKRQPVENDSEGSQIQRKGIIFSTRKDSHHQYKDGQGTKKIVQTHLTVQLRRCKIIDNMGFGFRFKQDESTSLTHSLDDCIFGNNGRGDISLVAPASEIDDHLYSAEGMHDQVYI